MAGNRNMCLVQIIRPLVGKILTRIDFSRFDVRMENDSEEASAANYRIGDSYCLLGGEVERHGCPAVERMRSGTLLDHL